MVHRKSKSGVVSVTSIDVAALAGVSQSAVSRAFGSGGPISPATRGKILKAAEKLNYVPNSIASTLASRRSGIVAVVHGDMHNPFFVETIQSFGSKLQARQRQMLTIEVNSSVTADDALMRVLRYQVDGIVLAAAQLSMRVTTLVQARGIPLVLFSRELPGHESVCVLCDNVDGGRQVAAAFLRAGARRYALVTAYDNATTSQDRARGFRDHLLQAGVPTDHIQVASGQSSYERAQVVVRAMFSGPQTGWPDALFCVNDIMALGAIDTLKYELLLRVPGDVMVAGFDDIPDGARAPYRLTTVRPPLDAMVDLTLEQLELLETPSQGASANDAGQRHFSLKGELIFRDSLPTPGLSPAAR
jgi:DNA-binding LacI/PurR family transcriptional regulator